MTLRFDHKFRALCVDMPEDEVRRMAQEICSEASQPEFLERLGDIEMIIYRPPVNNDDTHKPAAIRNCILTGLASVLMFVVFACGLYQIGSWVIRWVY